MTTTSKAARVALLLLSAGMAALPIASHAADKKKDQPAGPVYSADWRKLALPVQEALKTKDFATVEAQLPALEAASKSDDEVYFAQQVRLQLASGKLNALAASDPKAYAANESTLAAPLDALIANPKTAAEDRARYLAIRGRIEYNRKKYPEALAFYTKAQQAGSKDENLPLDIARTYLVTGNLNDGLGAMKKAIAAEEAAGRQAPRDWYLFAYERAAQAKNTPAALEWGDLLLRKFPSPIVWRNVIVYYGFQSEIGQTLDKRQRVDLFRLLRAGKALADQLDYREYAEDAAAVGLPHEAKAVIEEGRASGKLPAGNSSDTMLLTESSQKIARDVSLDTLATRTALPTGQAIAANGDALLGAGRYAQAVTLYNAAIAKGGLTRPDEVITHLGIAQALSGDKAGAQATFAKVTTEPRAQIARFWTTWLSAGTGSEPAK